MKIIDSKGKLFGKVNIFDLLIVVILVAALAFVGVKLFGNSGAVSVVSETKTITYKVKVKNVYEELYDAISSHLPDQLMAGGSMVDGYIVAVEKEKDTITVSLGNTESQDVPVAVEDDGLINLIFTIKAEISANSILTEVGSQEVRLGKSHIVKTIYTELTGTVISVEGR